MNPNPFFSLNHLTIPLAIYLCYFDAVGSSCGGRPIFQAPDRKAAFATTLFLNMQQTSGQSSPLVGVIMGSKSDWETMREAAEILKSLEIPHECRVVSAHRTPAFMAEYAGLAASRGIKAIIAGAGGAAHLPGMVAAHTWVPVLGVPVLTKAFSGLDSLLSIVQMPAGVPVATFAVGVAGARNAALFAASLLAQTDPALRTRLEEFRQRQADEALNSRLDG